jgi:hypothetical protein
MTDFGNFGELFDAGWGENGQPDLTSLGVPEALGAHGFEGTGLATDGDAWGTGFGDAHQVVADGEQPFLDAEVHFGSGPQYAEGMHGRIDASYDGGWSWETIT